MARAHAAHRLARADQGAEDVDGQHALQARAAHLVQTRRHVHHAGVVHQAGEHAAAVARVAVQRGEHRAHLAFVGDVGAQRQRTPAVGAHGVGHGFGRGLVVGVVDGDLPTLGGGQARRGGTDAAAGAGDEQQA